MTPCRPMDYPHRNLNTIAKLRAEIERLRNIDLDACAVPTPEQCEQMETGLGAIYTPRMALELGMKTAIGNVKRAIAEGKK
jgi:hypothetical protein